MTDFDEISEQLFGRRMRLPVARYVLEKDGGLVYQSEIAEETGFKPSYVQQELDRLARLGMVSELPKEDSRRRYYLRTDTPLWEIIKMAVAALDLLATGRRSPTD